MQKRQSLLRQCNDELDKNYGCRCRLNIGDERFDLIWSGTLKSLFDRTDLSGFCGTSYGEENNVRSYDLTHYPRDTAEAGRILAAVGAGDFTDRILAFSLDHIPAGQYYIPHVYHQDGSVRTNNIQVDTPAHLANALFEAVEVCGATPERERLFHLLDAVMKGVVAAHFHPECGLVDAGNYNEQGYEGSHEALLDMFTNAAFAAGCRSMATLTGHFAPERQAYYAEKAAEIADGIETRLGATHAPGYLPAMRWPGGEPLPELNWLPLYAHRWHAGTPERWRMMWESLIRETAIDWDGFRVITGETPGNRYKLLGKFYGSQLLYCAESGRQSELRDLIRFAAETVKRPSNLFPEWWYHHRPVNLQGYFKTFLDRYEGIYSSYCDDPDGDYTVDSGNCEQSAAFLYHVWHDVFGIEVRENAITLAPALLTPLELSGGPDDLAWRWDGHKLEFRRTRTGEWHIRLPIVRNAAVELVAAGTGIRVCGNSSLFDPTHPLAENIVHLREIVAAASPGADSSPEITRRLRSGGARSRCRSGAGRVPGR